MIVTGSRASAGLRLIMCASVVRGEFRWLIYSIRAPDAHGRQLHTPTTTIYSKR